MRCISVSVAFILLPLIVFTSTSAFSELKYSTAVFINESGVAMVSIAVNASRGINRIPLPIEPLEPTIEVRCSGYEVPWSVNGSMELYFYADDSCSGVVSYIANTLIHGGLLAIEIVSSDSIELTIASNIVLLTPPQNITGVVKRDGNLITIVFTSPARIVYTVATEPVKTPAATTPSPSPAAAPQPTPTTQTPTPTTTPIQTVEAATTAPPILTVAGVAVVVITITTAAIVLLKRRAR